MNDLELIDALIRREVGKTDDASNDPADRGGLTHFGITKAGYSDFLGRPATDADINALTRARARAFYQWLLDSTIGDLVTHPPLRGLLLDIIANHGKQNATRIIQRAVGVTVDGVFGKLTRAALAKAASEDPSRLFRDIVADRLEFTGRIITKNLRDDDHDGIPDNTEFAWGWLNRQAEFVRMDV